MLRALTWLLGCDIDDEALWTHSSTVIGAQGHVIGPAALQIPDEDGRFISHRPDHTGCVLLLPLTPVLQLKSHNNTQIILQQRASDLLLDTSICNCTSVFMEPGGLHHAHTVGDFMRKQSYRHEYKRVIVLLSKICNELLALSTTFLQFILWGCVGLTS